MTGQVLRPYQREGVDAVLSAWRAGKRRVLAVAPTGSGKTTLFSRIVADMVAAGKRAVVLVHRKELAHQAGHRFAEFGVEHGIVMPGVRAKPWARVQVAMVPTLARRELRPPADVVICDEAHLSTAESWTSVLSAYPEALLLGVTATPWRLTGKPLAGTYDELVVVSTPAELIAQGHLCPFQGFAYKAPSLAGLKKVGGDYKEDDLAERASEKGIVANIVEEWLRHSSQLSTVVFAVNVEHSRRIASQFASVGVRAEHVDGTTPPEMRRAILARVASGETRVLCNVGVAVEGLDIPRLKCAVLARPTASLARALQMQGRVMRPWGGVTARIHDHAFVVSQHGLLDASRDYVLAAGELPEGVAEAPPLTTCKTCFAIYQGLGACPACGKAREVEERKLVETDGKGLERVEFASGASAVPVVPVEVKWKRPRSLQGVYEKTELVDVEWGKAKRHWVRNGRTTWVLWGASQLDAAMAKVSVGALARVTYTGDTDIGGGRHRKEFRVEVEEPDPAQEKRADTRSPINDNTPHGTRIDSPVGASDGVAQNIDAPDDAA